MTKPERVLLVSMPFGALERPALSLGLLQAHCNRLGVQCDTLYLTFAFAEWVGVSDYLWLGSELPYTAFAGEWLFAEALYGRRPESDAAYERDVLRAEWGLDDAQIARLKRLRMRVRPFLDHCVRTVDWGAFTFVGFTSTFHQNLPSLAMAARVKEAWPQMTIAFGGANWEEEMGVALLERFPFADLAFSGEADESFPAVLAARREGRGVEAIPGVTGRGGGAGAGALRIEHLDDVPVPDFDAFFDQLHMSPAAAAVTPTLLVETSRGCWWGERSHCTFCGLNGATMAFRSKSPDRVLEEIAQLHERHGVATFSVVDDILDMRYFHTVLPMLAEAGLPVDFFWEVKANLKPEHVRALRDAGVAFVQPGIESLNDHVLALMRKGTTGARNVELLKWCREYGVQPLWNLLYGFPGETAEDYAQIADWIETIWHLDPPTGYGPIRLDRFSPYHAAPDEFGMVNVRPMEPFVHLYPVAPEQLMKIAYYFEFDYADGRADDAFAGGVIELVRRWMGAASRGALTLSEEDDGTVCVLDTRFATAPRRARLHGWKAAVYLACDRAAPLRTLLALPEVVDAGVAPDDVTAFLERCVAHRLMLRTERTWLNVAVHSPARELSRRAGDATRAVTVA
jgi:ribosomal peptide maturation radical SAM protein 1